MQQKGWMFLRVLLNRYCGGITEEISKQLPKSYVAQLQKTTLEADDPIPLLEVPLQRLSQIHYSWLAPLVGKLPKVLQLPTIAALTPPQSIGICRMLKCRVPSERPSPPFDQLLLSTLFQKLSPEERLPAPYLPASPLSALATYPKAQILRIVDLLGIRDLVQEMRLIVNKANQEALLRCLNEEERTFFDFYMYKEQDKLAVKRLDLADWKGDSQKLRQQLHLRGLIRLGKALAGQNPDLLWYILHSLDTGRAAIIRQHSESQAVDNVAGELRRQVIGLINHFSKNG